MLRPAFIEALKAFAPGQETPFFANDAVAINEAATRLLRAFGGVRFFYAMKANPHLGILRLLKKLGFAVEAVSVGEVLRAFRAGFSPDEVLMNGPVKTDAALRTLAEAGVPRLGIDSFADLERVARHLPGAEVLIRTNPDLPVRTHPSLATGRGDSQFGFMPEDLPRALARAKAAGLRVLGLHLHLGSSLGDARDFAEGYRRLYALASELGPFSVVDLGGGFGLDLEVERLAPLVEPFFQVASEVWLEPGRFLVARAGVLVARVWGTKQTRRRYLLLDAGMTQFLRPALYGATPPIVHLYEGQGEAVFDLVGPACESGDVIARDVRLPIPSEGDLILIGEAGAYGSAMSSNYLDTPRPAAYLFDGQCFRLLARAEEASELWKREEDAGACVD